MITTTFGILSLILSAISALYLQLPTFVLSLGYGWSHNYPLKRWVFRILALAAFLIFIQAEPKLWALLAVAIPFVLLWTFSLFNANPNLFIALDDSQILKEKEAVYPGETEIIGYVNEEGNAVCYPVNEMVMPRHLLNDVFCEKPLLISFCAACRSTMLYNPVAEGRRLTFEVLGVHRRNMVIRDTQTGTVWQQGTGEAMFGRLKGTRLEYYPYQQTTLADWTAQYPETYVAKEADDVRRGFVPKERLMKLLRVTEKFIAPGRTDISGLPAREKIWGLQLNGRSKAYPVSGLKKTNEIRDSLGGSEIRIQYDPKTGQITGTVSATNEQLKFQNHWWFGWKEFHPDTEVWRANS